MKENNALIYPVSFVPAKIVEQLSILFDKLELLLPSDLNRSKIEELLGEYAKWVKLTSVPFSSEEEQDNYKAIVKDFKAWASQVGLGMGTTASALYESVTSGFTHDVQTITDAIKGRSQEDPLLEARLFLEFALEYDLEQEMLVSELKDLSKEAERIEAIMAGPGKKLDGQYYSGASPQPLEPFYRRVTQVKKRLEAWHRLYLACASKSALFTMPLGISLEVKDVIDETYESMMDKELPLEIFKIGLSGLSKLSEEEHDTVKAAIHWITSQLSTEPVDSIFKEIEQEAAKLEELLPQDQSPCLALTHYPSVHWIELLAGKLQKEEGMPDFYTKANWSFYLY